MNDTQLPIGFNAFWWEKLWDEQSIAEVVNCLAALGYQAVEYKEASFNPEEKMADAFRRAVQVTEQNGLTVSNFCISRNATVPAEMDTTVKDVTAGIRACAEAGVTTLNVIAGGVPDPVNPNGDRWFVPPQPQLQPAWDCLFSCFEAFLEAAEECRVYLALEALVGTLVHDYYSTLELVRRFPSEYLGLTMDPSHYLLHGNDIPWAIRQWGDRIKHVHLKDAVGRPGEFGLDFLFPLLGEGAIQWDAFMTALREINYQGVLSVEFESFKYMDEVLHNDPARAAELSMQSVRGLGVF